MREVRDMFSAAVQAVVQRASSAPEVYRDSVLVLSVCPFSWHEERCVMRSGLLYLLDKLCSMRSKNTDTALNLSAMAWAGFQVLLDRIVQWENGKGKKLIFAYVANWPLMVLVSLTSIFWARHSSCVNSLSHSPLLHLKNNEGDLLASTLIVRQCHLTFAESTLHRIRL